MTDIFDAVLKLLRQIPVIGDVIDFIVSLVDDACSLVQELLDVFPDPPDLGCGKKRGLMDTTGVVWPQKLRTVWAAADGARGCLAPSVAGFSSMNELLWCTASTLFVGADAVMPNTDFPHVCFTRAPDLYRSARSFSNFTAEEQGFAIQCSVGRGRAEIARQKWPWVRVDAHLDSRALPLMAMDMVAGFKVYRQYYSDRSTPTASVVSSVYKENWAAASYDTSHLATLAALPTVDAAQATLATDNAAAGLTLEQYATRAAAMGSDGGYDPTVVAGAAAFFRAMLGRGPLATGSAPSSPVKDAITSIVNATIARLAAQQIMPPPRNISLRVLMDANSTSIARKQISYNGARSALVEPFIVLARFITRARNVSASMPSASSVGASLYTASVGALRIARDVVTGAADSYSAATLNATAPAPFGVAAVRWRYTSDGLSAWGARVTSQLGHAMTAAWSSGPTNVAATLNALRNRSVAAAERREKLSTLGAFFTFNALTTWYTARTQAMITGKQIVSLDVAQVEGVRRLSLAPGVSTVIDCLSPWQSLCDECLVVDNGVGTLIRATVQAAAFYAGDAADEPSFNHSKTAFDDYNTYLTLGTWVEIGDDPELPIRWPWSAFYNFRVLGDPTPNKMRFDDVADDFSALYNLFALKWNGGGIGLSLASATPGNVTTINGVFARVLGDMARRLPPLPVQPLPPIPVGVTAEQVAASVASEIVALMQRLITWVISSVKTCSYEEELTGAQKRFSIAEALLLSSLTGATIGALVGVPLVGTGVMLGITIMGNTLLFAVMGTLWFTYNWSFSCFPALPYQLADDSVYALTHTVFPACDFLFAGQINEEGYTNDNCKACELYTGETAEFTYASCTDDIGMKDLAFNIVFIVKETFPDFFAALKETTVPILQDLMHLSFVQERLNAFDDYDKEDAIQFSQYWYAVIYLTLGGFYTVEGSNAPDLLYINTSARDTAHITILFFCLTTGCNSELSGRLLTV